MDIEGVVREAGRALGSEKDAQLVLEGLRGAVFHELSMGGSVDLRGFGRFDLSPSGQPRFRPAAAFRHEVARTPTTTPPAGESPLRFQRFRTPEGVSLSAILPMGLNRCGIYVLHFEDGSRYVGQAIDVLNRFGAHRRHWPSPIVALDFASVPRNKLDRIERETVQHLERQGVPLRNTALVGLPMGNSALDVVVDRVQQEEWLIEGQHEYDVRDRCTLARRSRRGPVNDKFKKLSSRRDFEQLRYILLVYLMEVMPWPHVTERRFWTITSLPSTNRRRDHHRLSAVSVNNVETLVIWEEFFEGEWLVGGFMNLAPTDQWRDTDTVRRHRYQTVGDVDMFFFPNLDYLFAMLQEDAVLEPARRLALGLMRKGNGMMSKYHDEDFADRLFSLYQDVAEESGE